MAHIARVAGSKTAKPDDFSMAPKQQVDPSDGKAFVRHVRAVLDSVKRKPEAEKAPPVVRRRPRK
jgi:hypothetical protein